VREIGRGIHPAVLAKGGLGAALGVLARRSPIPVHLDIRADGRLPGQAEVSAYYVVAEALTNAARHARASAISVEAAGGACTSRSATTEAAAPTSPAAPAWPASKTA
jgi:signal transduction histidine kinase